MYCPFRRVVVLMAVPLTDTMTPLRGLWSSALVTVPRTIPAPWAARGAGTTQMQTLTTQISSCCHRWVRSRIWISSPAMREQQREGRVLEGEAWYLLGLIHSPAGPGTAANNVSLRCVLQEQHGLRRLYCLGRAPTPVETAVRSIPPIEPRPLLRHSSSGL